MEVVADLESTTHQSARLKFPDRPLPQLSVIQPKAGIAYFEVVGGETPLWMFPVTAWQHGHCNLWAVVYGLCNYLDDNGHTLLLLS